MFCIIDWGIIGVLACAGGFVASFHLRDDPLCCSTEHEVEERRYDELQGEPI